MVNVSRPDAPSSQSHRAEGTASAHPAPTPLPLFVLPPHPQRVVISTEAAHAFVSSAVEKSASLPGQFPGLNCALAVVLALAFLVVSPDEPALSEVELGICRGPCLCLLVLSSFAAGGGSAFAVVLVLSPQPKQKRCRVVKRMGRRQLRGWGSKGGGM